MKNLWENSLNRCLDFKTGNTVFQWAKVSAELEDVYGRVGGAVAELETTLKAFFF